MPWYLISGIFRKKKALEDQRELANENLNALINNTEDLMWSIDKEFNLITCNTPFNARITRITGKPIEKGMTIFPPGYPDVQVKHFKKLYERAFSGEAFMELEYTETPVEIWSEISYYPIRYGNQIIGCACYLRNITERKKAEKEREKIVDDLLQHSKNLEQFTYIVSHNLRSPVTQILGISNILKGKLSDEDRSRSMEFIFTAAEQLDKITKDLNQILQIKSEIKRTKANHLFFRITGSHRVKPTVPIPGPRYTDT